MTTLARIDRRTFVSRLGRHAGAAVLLGTGAVACSSSSDGTTVTTTTIRTTTSADGRTTTSIASTTADESMAPHGTTGPGAALRWERVSFDFVSAYVLARDGAVALVDTGVTGSADRFEPAFSVLDVGWTDVDHVILTHLHSDHVGGLGEVLAAAPDAVAHAGEADIAGIDAGRPVQPLADGDEVLGLRIIATPGHTAGHVSVLDEASGLLVAGDALTGDDKGGVGLPNAQFTADTVRAGESVRELARLNVEAIVFGHGEPVTGGGRLLLETLVAGLA